ncbi:MAG: MSCRAMM family protein [Gemmatimonadaceae bacterium]
MTVRALLQLGLALAPALQAQVPLRASTHAVQGQVFDSLAGAPLAGAVVHVAPHDLHGRPLTATTDTSGRFRFSGLPAGRFVIDFEHDVLRALGLESPLLEFVLATDTLVTIDLGVPSSAVVRSLKCGASIGDGITSAPGGLLAGFVRDAAGGHLLGKAIVAVSWNAIALDSGDFRTVVQRVRATTDADGAYRLCGLPVHAPLGLRITSPGARDIVAQISVPEEGVARRDFRLADSALVRGDASVRGYVVRRDGKPVTSGRAVIATLSRDVPVREGTFHLTDLPLGSWAVEVRALGLEPQTRLIDATVGEPPLVVRITLDDRPQQLDAVTVVGRPSRESRILDDVLRRQRSSPGTAFLPGSSPLQNALHTADVLRSARGFSYRSPTEVYGRRLGSSMCSAIAVYLNGAFFPGGLEGLDDAVSVREVLAIEAYSDIAFAPIQWRIAPAIVESQNTVGRLAKTSSPACAVVVVWTRR